MTHYPLPSHAASAWVAGDDLWLAFGPLHGTQGHSVPFKIDLAALRSLSADFRELRGIVLALETLKARNADSVLGTRGSPCRHEIQRAIENDERYRSFLSANAEKKLVSEIERKEAEEFLSELGL